MSGATSGKEEGVAHGSAQATAQATERTTMRAARMHRYGGPDVLVYEDAPRPPSPGEGQVLVRVAAAGLGPWDGEIRRGEWQGMISYPLPLILGTDLSGTVEEVGPGVDGLSPGDEVYGVADMTLSGSNAQFALARAGALAPRPASLDHETAASVPVAAVTGRMMVEDLAKVQAGQTVFVPGAGGGVGNWAVQFAKRSGARVVATASGDDLEHVRALGADEVIDHRAERFEERVRDADAVIDPVPGNEVKERAYGTLKPGGVLVLSASEPVEGEAERHGVRATFVMGEVTTERLNALTELLDAGEVRPRVGEVLGLEDAAVAHEMLEGAAHRGGKIVLRVDG